jgi:hypothetical protein
VGALKTQTGSESLAGVIAFGVIAVGGAGSVAAGLLADRLGVPR